MLGLVRNSARMDSIYQGSKDFSNVTQKKLYSSKNLDIKCFLSKSAHVTMKTGVMMLKIQLNKLHGY